MNGFIEKIKQAMLGIEYVEDDEDGYWDDPRTDSRRPVYDGHYGSYEPEPSRGEYGRPNLDDAADSLRGGVKKSARSGKNTKILDFQSARAATAANPELNITHPTEVVHAAMICDYVREGNPCIVNLEGLPREKSQRIADYLGGVIYALGGEIKRVSNEIFAIAPPTMAIAERIDMEKSSSPTFPRASAFR
jgi:FtsZ-interacting cell division protein YlmF